jgi:hypothetical protein
MMLAIRRWLDDGGIAGLLADRTLPGNSQRSKSIVLPFLNAPAAFSDGRFRLAAMLRQKVVSWPACTRRARLRPASSGSPTSAAAPSTGAGRRDLAIRAALGASRRSRACAARRRTWFNFTTSGLMPMRRRLLPHRPEPRAAHDAARRAWLMAGTALVLAGAVAAAPGFDLGALTTLLGQVRAGEATFVETRRVEMLDRTLMSSGRLSFRAPDKFVRETLKPRHEKLAVDGNTLTMSLGERSRTMQLDASPEAAVLVEAVRGTLTGNRSALERLFVATVSPWRLGARAGAATCACAARCSRFASGAARRRCAGRGAARRRRLLACRSSPSPTRTLSRCPASPIGRRAALTLALWLGAAAAGLAIAWRAHYVADLSAFLPAAPTAEQAVLLDQLKSGIASRLVLIAIDGAPASADPASAAAARADASRRLAAALRPSNLFASVANGENAAWADAGKFVFEHRYQLSPAVDAARFSTAGLRNAIDETVALLGTPAGSLLKPILFRDPTGETIRIAEALTPTRAPRSENGVWVARQAPRALLLATTRADGADLDGQQRALAAIRSTFDAVATPGLRLAVSGAGRFAVDSRERIKAEVERLAILGSVIIVALLLLAFASLRALLVALVPVATGVVAGIAAVSLVFGQVHGMTLGFGTTLIGEAVDYAIYFLVQARGGPGSSERWRRESWPTVRLGLFTSLIGFAALVFTGFPGLAQLGVFDRRPRRRCGDDPLVFQ